MDFKYIKNVVEGGEAVILLHGEIGNTFNNAGEIVSFGIDGASFAHEMQYLQDRAASIKVSINSIGGTILDGYSIMSSILDSKVKVTTSIDGLAASIAGVIAMTGSNVEMKDFGTLMMHNPSGGSDKEVLSLMKASLVTVFKNRTNLSEDQVAQLMNSETWMNAEQAMENGMIDKIITSGKKVKTQHAKNLDDLVLIYNKLNTKPKNMESITNKLGIDSGSTEKDVVNSISELQATNSSQLSEIEAKEQEIQELKDAAALVETEKVAAAEAAKLTRATEMVNSFGDKVKAEDKEATIKLAVSDFDSVKNLLEMSAGKKATKIIDHAGKKISRQEETPDLTLREMEKAEPKELENIRNNQPEVYASMYKKQYGVEYTA